MTIRFTFSLFRCWNLGMILMILIVVLSLSPFSQDILRTAIEWWFSSLMATYFTWTICCNSFRFIKYPNFLWIRSRKSTFFNIFTVVIFDSFCKWINFIFFWPLELRQGQYLFRKRSCFKPLWFQTDYISYVVFIFIFRSQHPYQLKLGS